MLVGGYGYSARGHVQEKLVSVPMGEKLTYFLDTIGDIEDAINPFNSWFFQEADGNIF